MSPMSPALQADSLPTEPLGKPNQVITLAILFLQLCSMLLCVGEGNGNPLQCSCLENPRDGGAWWAAVYGVAWIRTRLKRLSSSSSMQGLSSFVCVVASVFSNSLRPYGPWPARLLCPWDSPGKNIEVVCHALLQGIFLTQRSNPGFLSLLYSQAGSLPPVPHLILIFLGYW